MHKEVNNINKITQWFLHAQPMTHKKLQKLLYFSYGIYLAKNNENGTNLEKTLFENNFEAWANGPVEPTVYNTYKNSGVNFLYVENFDAYDFNLSVMDVLNKTMELYGNYDADELEIISRNQAPWKNARKGLLPFEASSNLLSDADIYVTFKKELLHD